MYFFFLINLEIIYERVILNGGIIEVRIFIVFGFLMFLRRSLFVNKEVILFIGLLKLNVVIVLSIVLKIKCILFCMFCKKFVIVFVV